MTGTAYKHIDRVKTRHGQQILYYRPSREHRYRLFSEFGTQAFDFEYARATEEHAARIAGAAELPIRHKHTIDALSRKLIKCRSRDKARGLETTIDADWIISQLQKQAFCCALTGIPFQVKPSETKVNPYSPSIDRIDSSKGYTPDNARIVLYAINAMMLDWGDDVFRHVVSGFVLRNLASNPTPIPTPKKENNKIK